MLKSRNHTSPPGGHGDVDPILLMSTVELTRAIRDKALAPTDVVDVHIRRIEKVNPHINALIHPLFEQARKEAQHAEQRLATEDVDDLPPFLGVPFTSKENYRVRGLPQTGGLVRRKHWVAGDDAELVRRMRDAGFILLGTTNVPEGLMWFESYNRLYGRTTNAYSTRHTAGGSSGGEGAIVGSGGSPIGLGGDIGGSIRNPAFFNGVCGHKASGGRVPDTGTFPGSSGMISRYKVCGPIARRVQDLQAIMPILAGPDGIDPSVDGPPWGESPHFSPEDVQVYWFDKIGILKPHPETAANLSAVVDGLQTMGFEVRKWAPPGLHRALEMWATALSDADSKSFMDVIGSEGPADLAREWLRWPLRRSRHIFPSLALATIELAMNRIVGKGKSRSEQLRLEFQTNMESRLGDNAVWISPTFHRPAPRHGLHSFAHTPGFINCGFLNPLEMPSTAVPTGFDSEGLPLGVQVAASRNMDHLTLYVADKVEELMGGWRPAEHR